MQHHHFHCGYSLSNHIALDLSQRKVNNALASLQTMKKRMTKVKSAHVFCHAQVHKKLSMANLLKIFETLASMPNLRYLKVELQYFMELPIAALVTVIKGARSLRSLQLVRLKLSGSLAQAQTLGEKLQKHHRLNNLEVDHCISTSGALMTLVTDAVALKRIRLVGTAFLATALPHLGCSRRLQILCLEDLPDITDQQVASLALGGLSSPQCRLQELCLRSSMLSNVAGEAITDMLLVNKSIHTLNLQIDWEGCGTCMADSLKYNSVLRHVSLRCYGDDEIITNSIKKMALALRNPLVSNSSTITQGPLSSLQSLRLCLEIEPSECYFDIIEAFETLLDHSNSNGNNTILEELVLDDGIQEFPLPVTLQNKLQLNKCGFSRYLRCHYQQEQEQGQQKDPNSITAEELFVQAIISQKDNIQLLFHMLSQCPEFLCHCHCPPNAVNTRTHVQPTLSTAKELDHAYSGKAMGGLWSKQHIRTTKTESISVSSSIKRQTSFGRRVLSMFTPAA